MVSTSTTVAAVAVTFCGLTLLPLFYSGIALYNEISNFYDDSMTEILRFQKQSDNAERVMIDNGDGHKAFKEFVARAKRGADQCNCGGRSPFLNSLKVSSAQPNTCPPGAAGPPGAPGQNGDDGAPG